MIKKLFISLSVCLFAVAVQAQDSVEIHFNGVRERVDQVEKLRNNLYYSPSLRPFQYKHSQTPVSISYRNDNKDLYNLQQGSGMKGFGFNTDSYQKDAFPDIILWGNASYENIKLQDLKFNETSDYDIVFPYLTADSVGGDLNSELYKFSGGLSKQIGDWIIAGEAGYKANLAHRKRDPRPENNSSDIQAKVGVSYLINDNYVLATNVGFRYYKQRNELSFLAVLGRPPIFQLNGLGAYNSLLSGSIGTVGATLFETKGVNARITFAPKDDSGFIAKAGVDQNSGFRTLSLSTANANDWEDQIISAKAGYIHNNAGWRFGALANMSLHSRKGTESLFNNDGGNTGYVKIAEISSYRYYNFNYNLEGYIGKSDWSVKPYITYNQFKEQYINPFKEQKADIVKVGIQGQYLWDLKQGLFGISLNLQQQKVLKKNAVFNGVQKGSAIENMLQQNYSYLIAEPFLLQGELRYDFVISKQVKPFVIAEASSASKINQKYVALTLGLVF